MSTFKNLFAKLRTLMLHMLHWPLKLLVHFWLALVASLRWLWRLWRRLGPTWLRVVVLAVALVVGLNLLLSRVLTPNLTQEQITSVHYLNGGWSDTQRQTYYYTPQGTELLGLDYDWFVNLELPFSHQLLASEENLRGWGFIMAPLQQGSAINPGNLPVGFARHTDPVTGKQRLDLSCAMCHTGELHYQGTALRVDGGQALHSVATVKRGEFITTLAASVIETLLNPRKFSRFAERMVGEDKAARKVLKKDLWAFAGRIKTFATGPGALKWYPVEEGRGRTDAVGRIANVVFGFDMDVPSNYRVADAPASYPFVWDMWRFDWVQYTGFTNQPMARNVGEALGVLAPIKLVDEQGQLLKGDEFAQTVVDVDGMHCIEGLLRELKPPAWPENILGRIDIASATRGKDLFADKCAHCHGPHPSKPYDWPVADGPGQNPAKQNAVNWQWDMAGDVSWQGGKAYRPDGREQIWSLPWIDLDVVGTDAQLALNYINNTYDASKLAAGQTAVNAGNGLQLLLNELVPLLYQRWGVEGDKVADFDGLNIPFRIQNRAAYTSRPLHGVWATPPFLHNGSVPSIYALLSPLQARPVEFYVGNREYDPAKLGYVEQSGPGSFLHDTRIAGNHNTGHLFTDVEMPGRIGHLLSERQRMDLIEYLKVMGNPAFSEALGGDPLNWDNYPEPPVEPGISQTCAASHQVHGLAMGGSVQ